MLDVLGSILGERDGLVLEVGFMEGTPVGRLDVDGVSVGAAEGLSEIEGASLT